MKFRKINMLINSCRNAHFIKKRHVADATLRNSQHKAKLIYLKLFIPVASYYNYDFNRIHI